MALITWNERFSVSIPQIDQQHKKWIDIVNRLHEAMAAGKGNEVIGAVLLEMVNYSKMHLDFEEKLLTQHSYPDLAAHKLQHDVLRKRIHEVYQKYQAGNKFLTLDVMNMLKDWLLQHIEGVDKKYSSHLVARGVQ
ncbi:MAG: bacteriohemerythrin [bacterium]|nr:bacteriohemerythrin [bacterium]